LNHSLDVLSSPVLLIGTLVLTLLSFEAGLRAGRRRAPPGGAEASIGAIVGATLGLLAFMLAFTFGMAASHYDQRRKLVLDEADAIGTAVLRADLLPRAEASEARRLFREYVRTRLSVSRPADLERALPASAEIHRRLWAQAVAVAGSGGNPLVGRYYVPAVNEVISVHGRRTAVALHHRVPGVVWFVLYVLMAFGMGAVGYQTGSGGSPRSLPIYLLTLAFSLVILLIVDLEDPIEGLLRGNQQALVDVAATIAESPAD
jgi:hypothetical protein